MFIRFDLAPMRFTLGLLFVALMISASLAAAQADMTRRAFIPVNNINNKGAGAVDAKGVRYDGKNYRNLLPWIRDVAKTRAPEYPHEERARRHEGSGLFQLTLDLKTGAVTRVTVVRSTGFPELDRRAVSAYRSWRWKPGKWKEITIPTRFRMGTLPPEPLPRGAIPIPNS